MKKKLLLLMIVLIMATLCACDSPAETEVDFKNPHEAADALRAGENVIGKTMMVIPEHDAFEGFIFREPSIKYEMNINVILMIYDESTGKYYEPCELESYEYSHHPLNNIKAGDTVILTIVDYRDHYDICFYGEMIIDE